MKRKAVLKLAVAVSVLVLAACGGTGNETGTGATTKSTTGVITGFGSVYVNGVEYNTDTASFTADGVSSTEDSLAIGMVVTLMGSVSFDGATGTATSVTYEDEIEGLVVSNDLATGGSLNVMGQTIVVDDLTKFESDNAAITNPAQLVVNSVVEISGYSSGLGTVIATRIELKSDVYQTGEEIELKGIVANIDTGVFTFMIGNLIVDYSSAQLDNIPNNILTDGLYVEVKSIQTLAENNTLIALKVEQEGDGSKGIDGEEGDTVELEGAVTKIVSDNSFMLNGQLVSYGETTTFSYGTGKDLVVNVKLEVEGTLNADNVLVATEIEFRKSSDIELNAYIQSTDTTNNTVTVFGVVVQVTNLTAINDEQDQGVEPVRYFSVSNLRANDRVEIHAYKNAAGSLVATELVRIDDEQNQQSLEGKIESVTDTQLVVGGVTVDLTQITDTFLIDTKIEISGEFSGDALIATDIAKDGLQI